MLATDVHIFSVRIRLPWLPILANPLACLCPIKPSLRLSMCFWKLIKRKLGFPMSNMAEWILQRPALQFLGILSVFGVPVDSYGTYKWPGILFPCLTPF